MIELSSVEWRNDGITREYVEEHREQLEQPEKMKPGKLGEACTYCKTIDNPYAYEIMRRSGHLDKFLSTFETKGRGEILRAACRYHGFMLY